MSGIKSQHTIPEMVVRSLVHRMGYRFRLHRKDLPGKPDIVLPQYKKAIFINGCFWHGHRVCRKGRIRPATHKKFWDNKISATVDRDRKTKQLLRRKGWGILTIWECELRNIEKVASKILNFVKT